MAYDSAMSRDRAIINLLISDRNYPDILDGKIQNAYLNDPTKEKFLLYAGDEWNYD